MLIKEYRVVLPMSVEEYHVGQLYGVAKASRQMSNSKERVEVLVNEPYEKETPSGMEKGQYTEKIYHIASRVPGWIRWAIPGRWMQLHEKAWNAYPYCRTVLTTPALNKFEISVTTIHAAGGPVEPNIHHLEGKDLDKREVVIVDMAFDALDQEDYKAEEDPTIVASAKTGRGPLARDWKETSDPIMTAYKLVSALCKIFGFQGKIEKHIHQSQHKLLIQFHRKVFCWMDEWIDLSIADIRRMEEETKKALEGIKTDSEVGAGDDAGSGSAAAPPPAGAGDDESDEASK